jgi:hypothetical protein
VKKHVDNDRVTIVKSIEEEGNVVIKGLLEEKPTKKVKL